jgi:homocysteine S-methyltransferase
MDRAAFAALIASRVLLSDGGTGSALLERGRDEEVCDVLNVRDRDLIREVHEGFVAAGSEVIETNTFSANRFRLGGIGESSRVVECNLAGVARAREAGARFVAGSVGPLGVRLAPYGRVPRPKALEAFTEQITALVDGGADLLVIETFSDLAEARCALEAARTVAPDIATIVTLTFTRDDRTLLGETPEKVAIALRDAGADAFGANCSEGPEQVLRVLTAMHRAVPEAALVAQPNAGGPQRRGGRTRYTATPEYVARFVPAYLEVGARIIGGCCGTRPVHIAALRRAIDDPTSVEPITLEIAERSEPIAGGTHPTSEPGSRLAASLAARRWIVTVEMEPPHGPSPARMIAAAETLRDAGATTVNVADSPRAQMRMSPWAAAHLIQIEAGVETILHFPTRGRNLLRIQSDLLAAHALGLRNLFAVMGDPVGVAEGESLNEVTPSGLISLVSEQLNAGVDGSGAALGEATRFTIGCAINPNADDLDREIRVLRRKLAAGARFALTQPVYDAAPLDRLLVRYAETHGALELPLLVGLLPLASARHAEFLRNEVPGIDIPDAICERIGKATDERDEGKRIAIELIESLRPLVAGVYLIPAFRRYDAAAELIDELR